MKMLAALSAFAIAVFALTAPALAAEGKCTNIKAKCAVEIGGQCDPKTGRWFYGCWEGKCAGGTTQAFIACLDRANTKR